MAGINARKMLEIQKAVSYTNNNNQNVHFCMTLLRQKIGINLNRTDKKYIREMVKER